MNAENAASVALAHEAWGQALAEEAKAGAALTAAQARMKQARADCSAAYKAWQRAVAAAGRTEDGFVSVALAFGGQAA